MNLSGPKKELQRVLSLLLMRFKLPPYKAVALIEEWLQIHSRRPDAHNFLADLIWMGGVTFKDGTLQDVYPEEIQDLLIEMRGSEGITIKDRRHNFKLYRKSFLASEAVDWLMKTQNITREDAIEIGQTLINYQIIHHVGDEPSFRDGNLFYRFYIDEG